MGGQPRVGIHVRTVATRQSFNCPGAALLQNIGSRVWRSHTVCLSIQGGFLTLAFCTMSKRGAEICLLLWAPGGSPSLKLWKGWLFRFFHCYVTNTAAAQPGSLLPGWCLLLCSRLCLWAYHRLHTQNVVNPQLSNVDVPVLEGYINF